MDSSKSPAGSVRRAGRNISHPMLRRSTKGPLDNADDPLSVGSDQHLTAPIESIDSTPATQLQSPILSARSEDSSETIPLPSTLRFLQNSALYHRIPTDLVPPEFLASSQQPPANTSLTDLLATGHYRRAAEAALLELLSPQRKEANRVLQLLHCRLACLTIISRPDVAADEALPLLDYLTSNTVGVAEALEIVPWPLRVLLVRLQSVGAQDGGRRTIMMLYNLAAEVRAHIEDAKHSSHEEGLQLWSQRLLDLGLQVSDTLVEMGELETAQRHLTTLPFIDNDELCMREAMLYLRLGNLQAASRVTEKLDSNEKQMICQALINACNGSSSSAVGRWQTSQRDVEGSQLLAQNEAVYLLYAGRIDEATRLLESMASESFHTLLFNLSTLYELTSENAVGRKLAFIQSLASTSPSSPAILWERTMLDFKL